MNSTKDLKESNPALYIETLERVLEMIPWRCTVCGNYPCNYPAWYRRCDKWELAYRFVKE